MQMILDKKTSVLRVVKSKGNSATKKTLLLSELHCSQREVANDEFTSVLFVFHKKRVSKVGLIKTAACQSYFPLALNS